MGENYTQGDDSEPKMINVLNSCFLKLVSEHRQSELEMIKGKYIQ